MYRRETKGGNDDGHDDRCGEPAHVQLAAQRAAFPSAGVFEKCWSLIARALIKIKQIRTTQNRSKIIAN